MKAKKFYARARWIVILLFVLNVSIFVDVAKGAPLPEIDVVVEPNSVIGISDSSFGFTITGSSDETEVFRTRSSSPPPLK